MNPGATGPWQQVVAMHPGETISNGVYHLAVTPGTIDLRTHLHVIAY